LIVASAGSSLEQNAMDTGKRHLASLDSLRGVGVILIFANHYILSKPYILFGWIGLWIFFALSGFLITDGLLKMRALPVGQYFGRFYAKRAFRILPAVVIFFTISVARNFNLQRGIPRATSLGRYWI
jgi:peptidoglycan/LPS O-acetylase OafA/YrhL